MKVRPFEDYHLMGTSFKLDSTKVYSAVPATNIPKWEENGKIFVFKDEDGPSILLENGEYEIVA